MNIFQRRRFMRKVNKLSAEMARLLTPEDALSTARNINAALHLLPDQMREGLIDRLLDVTKGALEDVGKIH